MLNITPKSRQITALNLLRQHWKQHRTLLLSAPVGFGKTAIAAFITDGFISQGMRVMFVAPYTVLLNQTATRFIEYGLPEDEISYVWRNHCQHHPDRLIQIGSADTLIRRTFPDNIDLLIVDEAHIKRDKLLKIISKGEMRVIGLSGTPFAPWMGKYYEKLIKPTTMRDLINIGDLSRYDFFAPDKPDLSDVKTTRLSQFGDDYVENQIAKIMSDHTLVGNIVQNWIRKGEDRPTLCFCVSVAHANAVANAFTDAGVPAAVIIAETPQEERREVIQRFEAGEIKIIVNVGVLTAGFDSDVRCIIYARPTKSEIRWIQCLGRGLRTAAGKDSCLIFDHSGTVDKLGFPDDIEYDDLPSEKKTLNIAAPTKTCPECHCVVYAGFHTCPECGFDFGVEESIDVSEADERELIKVRRAEYPGSKEEKQDWWSQLKYYQAYRKSIGKPISNGWCSHTYREKFGCWPEKFDNTPKELTPTVSHFIQSKMRAFAQKMKFQQVKKCA
ncbi:DEAD/DEAH box helicase [Arsenophonus nasoniae]|uniref:DEAD/DEAH box helicase n=1 Tax=Arsenophonus nasoniae TaxID=638 RepID=D2U1C2_9GAMM|nr:DEAD/DEAH box helicase [Arsenophonus nasoniae]WGM05017.1 DEAD/DEAH box helicase [Arsenophonus nasoniae]CBA74508.1 phage DNA primase/helicase [Arsenophonus nasoniae]